MSYLCCTIFSHYDECFLLDISKIFRWDVSLLTDMTGAFSNKYDCNPDISRWNVSRVTKFVSFSYEWTWITIVILNFPSSYSSLTTNHVFFFNVYLYRSTCSPSQKLLIRTLVNGTLATELTLWVFACVFLKVISSLALDGSLISNCGIIFLILFILWTLIKLFLFHYWWFIGNDVWFCIKV